jgi:hypothetical protein
MSKRLKITYGLGILLFVFLFSKLWSVWNESSELTAVKNENIRMTEKITESETKQKQAIIQKRISEQLEEIALQQKLVTEKQKKIALDQRSIAEEKKKEAVLQKQLADKAKLRAVDAFKDAEQQREIAIEEKNIAKRAEQKASRLRLLALARSLAARSINQSNSGNDTLAAMLATTAWDFTSNNNGDHYQSELFQALKLSAKEKQQLRLHKGHIRDVLVLEDSESKIELISISEMGEVAVWKRKNGALVSNTLLSDQGFDFRKLAASPDKKYVSVSDSEGNIHVFKLSNSTYQFVSKQADHQIDQMCFLTNNLLVFVSESNIIGMKLSDEGSSVRSIYGHTQNIGQLEINTVNNKLYFSDYSGKIFSFNPEDSEDAAIEIDLQGQIISCFSWTSGQKLVAGTKSGKIYLQKSSRNDWDELVGHLSQVNDLVVVDDLIYSISYDKTVRLWKRKGNAHESIIIEKLNDWGYALDVTHDQKLVSAGGDKIIRVTTVKPKELALLVKNKVDREFTEEEWNTYVDQSINQESLKEREAL